jgi:hypothetical protein
VSSISSTTKAIWIALAIAVFFVVGLVDNAYKAGLSEGREQACARLQQDHNASMCAQLIGKDVAIDERVNEAMERK